MAIGIRGFAAIIAVAALMVIGVACGNGAEPTSLNEEAPTQAPPTVGGETPTTPIVSHGGPVKDYVSLVDTSDWKVATSIDDIDPNVCNLMHNRAPCTAEELRAQGMTPATGSITVGEYHPGGAGEGPGGAVERKSEPLFGQAVQSESQSDSGSSGFVYYFSADGEFVSVVVPVFEDGGESGNGAEPTSLNEEAPTQAPSTLVGETPTTPIVSHGGPVKDYVSLVDNLRAAGATVDPAGTGSARYFAPQRQLLTVNGERVETFEFASAEEADAAAEGVSATGSSIVTTMADGSGSASMITWVVPPHFYKAGKLIVIYVGCDSDVIDTFQEAMGPQFAGGAGVSQCPA